MRLIPLQRSSRNAATDCNLLEISDLQLLLECPLDLFSLSLFLPTEEEVSQNAGQKKKPKIEQSCQMVVKFPVTRAGIDAEPWYQSPDLSVLDVALIDAVVISRPESILALPFLTRNPDFTGQIFATFATATMGKMLMEELVSSHSDFLKLYGQATSPPKQPQFIQPEVTETMPQSLRDRLLGEHNSAISNWHKLYSADDVADCMKRIQTLRYGEEACIKGCIVLTPYSSGECLGASNWTLKGPCSSLAYISAFDVEATTANCSSQDVRSLGDRQVLLVSGNKPSTTAPEKQDGDMESRARNRFTTRPWTNARVEFVTSQNPKPALANSFSDEKADVLPKRNPSSQIAKAASDVLSEGGSVLIPVNVSDRVLELIEEISQELSSSTVSGKIFYVSPSAKEFLAFTNTVPEWISSSRQEKFYRGESLFGHVELLKESKLSYLSRLSPEIIEAGPCVVLASHASLRMGPSVHILNRWRDRSNYLLVLTEPEVDQDKILLPFKPLSMQIQHHSTGSAGALSSLIERLQPKKIVVPDRLKSMLKSHPEALFYSHRVPLKIPDMEEEIEIELSAELASRIKPKPARAGNAAALARLSAQMNFRNGNFSLEMPKVSRMAQTPQRFCGTPDLEGLLRALREKGLVDLQQSYVEQGDGSQIAVVSVTFHNSASIELKGKETVIRTSDPVLRRLIADAVMSCLQTI